MGEQVPLDEFDLNSTENNTGKDSIRLKYLAQINPTKSEVSDLEPDTEVSFLPLDYISTDGEITDKDARKLEEVYDGYTFFREGDIVLAKITPSFENGKGAICKDLKNGIGFGTTELHVFRPCEDVEPRYIWYNLRSKPFRDEAEAAMRGVAGQKRVPSEFVENYQVANISLKEQRRIADFLEHRIEPLEEMIDKKSRLVELLEERRQAVLTRTVTGKLEDSYSKKSTEVDWLGSIPENWITSPLKYQVSFGGGKTPEKSTTRYWEGDIPWITAKDMKSEFLESSEELITEEAVNETGITLYGPGTVVIVVRGMILAHTFPVGISTREITVNQDLKALIPQDTLDAEYLLRLLKGLSPVVLSLTEESAHGTKKLDTDQLKDLVIPVPPLKKQKRLLERMNSNLKRIDQLIESAERSKEILREKREAIITKAVNGQIDLTNWKES